MTVSWQGSCKRQRCRYYPGQPLVEAYFDRDILRYEREDVIYHVTYGEFQASCRRIGEFLNEKRAVLGRPLHVGIIGKASDHSGPGQWK